jgi:Flp pilus assembly CpaF family ATPase
MNINLNNEKVVAEVKSSFGAELWGYLTSNGWTDILVNPDGKVWIDDGKMHEIQCRTTAEGLTSAALTLASFSSQKFNTKEAQSLVAIIPILNIRCSFMGPPAVNRVSVSFRNPSKGIVMPERLLEDKVMSASQMDFLKDAIKNYRNILVSGGTGCHAKGEKILMYDKSVKEVQTIQVGELLMGDDGEPRKVLELHKGFSPMYKICPLGGAPYVVNEKHILVLVERTTGKRRYMTVEDFLLRPESWQRNMCVYYSKIRPDSKGKHKMTPFHVFKVGTGMYYGFTVDKNNLYCMHDYMVVHNSGKTTIMNSLMTFIEPTDRLYVAEDTSELVFTQPNVFNLEVNENFSYAEAIAQALRHDPTRIIIGECRYPEQAIEMLQSWNTGHPGGFSTLHANSAREVVGRLTELANRNAKSDQSAMVREAVDVVLQMRRVPGTRRRILAELWDARKDVLI